MKTIALYLDKDFKSVLQDWSEVPVFKILEVEDDVDLWGKEVGDSWEFQEDSGERECSGCGSAIEWERDISVTYSATVKEIVKPIKLG